jgi:hypothetical protein
LKIGIRFAARPSLLVDQRLEVLLAQRLDVRVGGGDPVLLHQPHQIGVHQLHALLARGGEHRGKLEGLALPDQVGDGLVVDHQLHRQNAAGAFLLLHQVLADHRPERIGEGGAHLLLLAGRESADDAVHGGGGGDGVHRPEHEVAGLGSDHRELDGRQVSHLAYQDHVRILAQRGAQGGREAARVSAHLALVDQALLALVDHLDRVLERDDVPRRVRLM